MFGVWIYDGSHHIPVESGVAVVSGGIEKSTNPVGLAAGFDKHGEATYSECFLVYIASSPSFVLKKHPEL